MLKRLSRFVVLWRYEDGTTYFVARDKKYCGFMYHLKPGEDKKHLYEAYEEFKHIVDDIRYDKDQSKYWR